MKQKITGFVYYVKWDWSDKPRLTWYDTATLGQNNPEYVLVGPHDFEVECPDDFDPVPKQVAALVAKKTEVRAELTKQITDLDAQINKLLAIENTVEAA